MTGYKNSTHTHSRCGWGERKRKHQSMVTVASKHSTFGVGFSLFSIVWSSKGAIFRRFCNFVIKCRLAMRAHLFIWQHKHILHDVKEVENYLLLGVLLSMLLMPDFSTVSAYVYVLGELLQPCMPLHLQVVSRVTRIENDLSYCGIENKQHPKSQHSPNLDCIENILSKTHIEREWKKILAVSGVSWKHIANRREKK